MKKRLKLLLRLGSRFLLLFVFIGAIIWALHETGMISVFLDRDRMLAFIDSLGAWGLAGFICLQIMQVVLAPIPGEATGFVGGYLYGPVMGAVWSTVGLTIGSYLAFALSRSFGRPFVERFVDRGTLQRFDYLLHHKGLFLVFLLFLIPGTPKDVLCYMLGLGHLTTLQFLLIGGIGRVFGTVLLSISGDMIRNEEFAMFFALAGITAVTVILAMIFRKKIERFLRTLHALNYVKTRARRAVKRRKQQSS
jgi:uncharacterized membrane protein YdjX (TVP38/TMEM64 family)